eukprot:jgi/Mesvir1/27945/Mv20157-RA.1
METEVQQLQRECAMLRERCAIWEKEVRSCQQRELRLQAKLARAEIASEIVSPSKRISDEHARVQLEKEVSSLQAMLVALRQDSDRRDVLHKKLETELELSAEREATLRAQLRQALTNCAERRAEIEELVSLNASLAEAVKGERRAKEEARDEVSRLHELLEGKEACVSATEEQCRVLDETIAEERAFLEAIDKDLVEKAEQLDGMREVMAEKEAEDALRLQAVNRELASLTSALEEREKEVEMLNDVLEERELHLDELRQALRGRDELAGKLKRQLAEMEAEVEETHAALREQEGEIRDLRAAAEERAGELEVLHHTLEHQEQVAEEAAEEAARVAAEAARREEEAAGTVRQQQLALSTLQEQLDEARGGVEAKREALAAVETRYRTLMVEVKALAGVLLRVLEGGMLGGRGGKKERGEEEAAWAGVGGAEQGQGGVRDAVGPRGAGYGGRGRGRGGGGGPATNRRASSVRAVAGSVEGDRLNAFDVDVNDDGSEGDDGHRPYDWHSDHEDSDHDDGDDNPGGHRVDEEGSDGDSHEEGEHVEGRAAMERGMGQGHDLGEEDEDEDGHHDDEDDGGREGEDEDDRDVLDSINDAQLQEYLQRLPESLQVPFAALAVLSTSVCEALRSARVRADVARAQAVGLAGVLGELEQLADAMGADASADHSGDFVSDVGAGGSISGSGAGRTGPNRSFAGGSREGGRGAAALSVLDGADASRIRRMVSAVKEHCRRLVEEREGLLGALEAAEDAAAVAEDDARRSAAQVAASRQVAAQVAEQSVDAQQWAAEGADRLRRLEELHRRALARAQDLEVELQRSREHTHALRRELQGCYARELAQKEQQREWAKAREGLLHMRKVAAASSAAGTPLTQRTSGTASRDALSPPSRSQLNCDAPAPSSAPVHMRPPGQSPIDAARPRSAHSSHSSVTRARPTSDRPSSRNKSISPVRGASGATLQRQASRDDGREEVSLDGFIGSPVKQRPGGQRPRTPEYLRMDERSEYRGQGSRAVRPSPAGNRSQRR